MRKTARPMNTENKKAIFYQIFLRSFTEEGTIGAARKMLPSIRDLGVTIVYLCPIVEADDDLNPVNWSERQKASGFANPKNPYRIKDYFRIDGEYGGEADLELFVKDAHALGMRVILDLVYLHCGPNAVFLGEHPSFVKRDASGAPITNRWNFPILNFEDGDLRRYLTENMLYFVRRFDVDGYRCDVADKVPLDFWISARKELEELKPDVVMLNEGKTAEYLEEAFEWNYSFRYHEEMISAFLSGAGADRFTAKYAEAQALYPKGGRCILYADNHDTVSDSYENRRERMIGDKGMEALFSLIYTVGGSPMIYGGNEICDENRHSIWSNRDFGGLHVHWENALTPKGEHRRAFLSELAALYRSHRALYDGVTEFLESDTPDRVIAYLRRAEDEEIVAVIHSGREKECVSVVLPREPREVLLCGGASQTYADGRLNVDFESYGYLLLKL